MNYKAYELRFSTALHMGKGKLTDQETTVTADVLFSALCQEALLLYGEKGISDLVSMARSGKFRLSDAFPCHNEYGYYLPKPMIEIGRETDGNSADKKSFKKLKYIRWDKFKEFCSGDLDAKAELDLLKYMGNTEMRTMSTIDEEKGATPFSVGIVKFGEGWGLYFILAYETEEEMYFAEDLLMSLELSGIGGKRSAGLGKFALKTGNLPESLIHSLTLEGDGAPFAALSVCMAEKEKLPGVLENAKYLLARKSGFVSSETYADRPLRKRDMFMFKAGSVFLKTFDGVIADVSSGGSHPVYRYGMPIFLEVKM